MRHNRKPRDLKGELLKGFKCTHCKNLECNKCVDIMRVVVNLDPICHCTAKNHDGEPRSNQIADPMTGDVHAPGGVITVDGEFNKH